METIPIDEVVKRLGEIRTNIHILIAESKTQKANGKIHAYNKSYCMISGMMFDLNQLKRRDKNDN